MSRADIDAALRQVRDTRCLRIGAGTLGEVGEVLAQHFEATAAVVVADERTYAAAGRSVDARLRAAGMVHGPPLVFPADPPLYAEVAHLNALEGWLRDRDAVPVVVGSGTLNDLTKLAAHRLGRPYLCVATAASMDGYTSFGAIVTEDGFKHTLPCPAPRAVIADLDVLAEAPSELNAAGYGDLLGKVTAGADWILADALEIEPIDERAWLLVQGPLRGWLERPERLPTGDPAAIELLFEGLTVTGIAMQLSSSSRPASGSEHRFSHLWEMQALAHGRPTVAHGFKVGVGSIAAAALYERVLTRDLTKLDLDALGRAWPARAEVEREVRRAHDSPQLAEHAVTETLAKHIDVGELRQRLRLLQERWGDVRERIRAQLLPATRLRDLLRAAGCPTRPAEIGIDAEQFRASYDLARTIRSRYTVLDLVHETGILAACRREMFGAGGFWAAEPPPRTGPARFRSRGG
jgi:glycerol-1-phosphate dehydrogenase [NAD(P)+]